MKRLVSHNIVLGVVAAVLSVAPRAGWSQGSATPEAAAEELTAALRVGDWDGMAARMHPAALSELRQVLEPLLKMPDALQFRTMVFDIGTDAAVEEASDEELFAGFMRFVMTQDPTMASGFATMELEVIGHLMEGDTAHVVSRMTMSVEGVKVSRMEVSSFRQHDGRWRGLLTGDVTGLAAALQAAFGQGRD